MSRTLLSSEQLEPIFQEMLHDKSKIVRNGLLMLQAHYRNPTRRISAIQLGHAAGYDAFGAGNIQYGKFARLICERAGYTPRERRDGKPIWTCAICFEAREKDSSGHIQWVLRKEVAEVIKRGGLFDNRDPLDDIAVRDQGCNHLPAKDCEAIVKARIDQPEVVKAVQPSGLSDDHDLLDDIAAKDQEYKDLSAKDREAVVKARIGQGRFREQLINHWNKTCAVTGCDALDLLIASHIKPWRESTSKEKLDVNNGLLLIPNLDAAFDKGYITFTDEGHLVASPLLSDSAKKCFGILPEMRLAHIYPQHCEYISFHRRDVFKGGVE